MCSNRRNYWILYFLIVSFFSFPQTIAAAPIVINEFVPNADTEWVEFFVASESADFVKSLWIDDDADFMEDSGSAKKKQLNELQISDKTYPFFEMKSFFNNGGDSVVLFDNSGEIIDQYSYDDDPGKNTSIGRNPDGTGPFSVLAQATKGGQNAAVQQPTPTEIPIPTKTPVPTKVPTSTKSPLTSTSASPVTSQNDEQDDFVDENNNEETAILGSADTSINKEHAYYALPEEETASVSGNNDENANEPQKNMQPWPFLLFGGLSFTGMVISAVRIVMKAQSG